MGAATAERLSAEGSSVVVVDIRGDRAEQISESLPGPSIAVTGDVSLEEDVDRYMRAAREAFGRVDLHFLNAGIGGSLHPIPDVRSRSSTGSSPSTFGAFSSDSGRRSSSTGSRAAAARS